MHTRTLDDEDTSHGRTARRLGRQRLYRPRDERVLAGVATGLGRRVGLPPWPARLLFVLVLMLIPGSQLLVYPALWLLMPEQ